MLFVVTSPKRRILPRERRSAQRHHQYITRSAEPGTAADGDETLRYVAVLRPDVIVMDMRLPGQDGAEVTAALKEAIRKGRFKFLEQFPSVATPEVQARLRSSPT